MNHLIIETMVSLISVWCSIDYKGYSRESKEMCIEFAVNTCFDNYGKPSEDVVKQNKCIDEARSYLKRTNK